MKSYEFYAVAWQGSAYCTGCVPAGAAQLESSPIFADQKVDSYPTCDVCGELHDYMTLLQDPLVEEGSAFSNTMRAALYRWQAERGVR